MSRPTCLRFILCTLVLCALCDGVEAQQKGTASHLQSEHREAVEQWLAQRPNLRPAVDGDYAYKRDLAAERSGAVDYHPFYLVADFNGDKKDDFAIALVNIRKKTANFVLAVFNGPITKDSLPAFFREGLDFRRMSFSAAEDFDDARRTSLFVQNPNTGKGWMLSLGRKGYFLKPSQEDFT
ncbi:MAG: hypothetical protein ABIU09_00580 [Pyrinomonadaceae bacterium]